MRYHVRLDGVDVRQEDVSNLNNAQFTLRINDDTGQRSVGFSSEITFQGLAYDYLFQTLIQDLKAGKDKVVTVEIFDACCDDLPILEGQIDVQSLEWCVGGCTLKASVIEKDPDYGCLLNALIAHDDFGFRSKKHPYLPYCTEMRPAGLQEFFLVLGVLSRIFAFTLKAAFTGLELIVFTLNLLITIEFSFWETISNLEKQVLRFCVGCGRGHPAPFVRDYVQNACEKCGLSFKSSILNRPGSPYHDTMYLIAETAEGTEQYATSQSENAPVINCLRYLDTLKPVFNAEYRIRGKELIFEHESYFYNEGVYFDTTQTPELVVEGPCFSFTSSDQARYYRFEYTPDGSDWVGNESDYFYNEIIDADPGQTNPRLRGEKSHIIPFGSARFRRDGVDRDILSEYSEIPIISDFLDIKPEWDNCLLLAAGKTTAPKLLIWDGISPLENAKVKRIPYPGKAKENLYNHDYWFSAPDNLPGNKKIWLPNENLLERFHIQDTPLNPSKVKIGWDFTLTIEKTCDLLKSISFEKTVILEWEGKKYTGTMNQITILPNSIRIEGTL